MQVDGGDGCPTVWLPINATELYTLNNGQYSTSYIMYVSPQFFWFSI